MRSDQLDGTKVSRSSVGGWSQARYQRDVDHCPLQHAQELVDALERVVRQDSAFTEDTTLLADVCGVGAMLRYRL